MDAAYQRLERRRYDSSFEIHDFAGFSDKDKAKFMGYRLSALVTTSKVIDQWMLASANFHDTLTMGAMLEKTCNSSLLDDGACHHPHSEKLSRKRNTRVIAPQRKISFWRPNTLDNVISFIPDTCPRDDGPCFLNYSYRQSQAPLHLLGNPPPTEVVVLGVGGVGRTLDTLPSVVVQVGFCLGFLFRQNRAIVQHQRPQ